MIDSQRTKGLWRTGKDEFKKFMKIKFKKSTNFVSYMFGILLTALPIFPIVWFIFELVEVYWYNIDVVYIFLLSAWVLFMFCNGLSNYITIKILKAYEKDMDDLQAIDDKAIFFYQTLNIGFGIFILIIIAFFFVSAMS